MRASQLRFYRFTRQLACCDVLRRQRKQRRLLLRSRRNVDARIVRLPILADQFLVVLARISSRSRRHLGGKQS